MTEYEARNKITKIVETTEEYQRSVNNVEQQLIDEISTIEKIKSNINKDIKQKDIVSYSSDAITSIEGNINSVLGTCGEVLNTLSHDATEEIRRIVDNYNNSIVDEDPDHPKARLSYVTISLASISGGEVVTTTSEDYGGSGGSNPPTYNDSLENYLIRLENEELYSKDIIDWEQYVNDFLYTYDLSSYVESITIEGKKIICKYKDGREEVFENVSNIDELVKKIKNKLSVN